MNETETAITLAEALEVIREQARRIEALQAEVAALKARLLPDPSTPSGARPVYGKPAGKGRGKRPGRKAGHKGERRGTPQDVTRTVEHALACCPHCGGANLKRLPTPRTRIVEDAPAVPPEAVEHVIHRAWCADCKKLVEPAVTAALPGMQLGLNLLVQTAWLHYGLGMTVGSVVKYLNSLVQVRVSAGGLVQMWARLAFRLRPVYEDLREEAKVSPVLHADETGWRVKGKTWWLWGFAAETLVFYVLRPSRGAKVVAEVLGACFEGVLCCDFFGAYNAIESWAKQRCVVHLLRELKKTSLANAGEEWKTFRRRLKRLMTEALHWRRRRDALSRDAYLDGAIRLHLRLAGLILHPWADRDAARIAKRLRRHQAELLTFLHTDAPADNNLAEREIRPAVLMRKNSYGNMSDNGAQTQAVLMSVFRTLHKRGEDPVGWVKGYLQERLSAKDTPQRPARAA